MSIQPRRVEIVGVAGTGKSTLTRALTERYPTCLVADSLHTRKPAHWQYVAHSLPHVAPLLVRAAPRRPGLSWDEVKFLVYVTEWGRYLDARAGPSSITVLDQGPLFALACLLWGQKPATGRAWFRYWVERMASTWSRQLGLVVWLDAPDDVLVTRINDREQRHDAKGRSTEDALVLLSRHREAYRVVLDEVSRLGRPSVRRLDTSSSSPAELVDELGRVFEEAGWLTGRGRVLNVR